MKMCSGCRQSLPLDSFHKDATKRDGLYNYCKECARDKRRIRESDPVKQLDKKLSRWRWGIARYGITWQEYEKMYAEQGGRCGICKERWNQEKMFAVDHDHQTGKVRGLLCSPCNLMLGNARDNVEVLQLGIEYLQSQGVKI